MPPVALRIPGVGMLLMFTLGALSLLGGPTGRTVVGTVLIVLIPLGFVFVLVKSLLWTFLPRSVLERDSWITSGIPRERRLLACRTMGICSLIMVGLVLPYLIVISK
jgi:hypothetical protein